MMDPEQAYSDAALSRWDEAVEADRLKHEEEYEPKYPFLGTSFTGGSQSPDVLAYMWAVERWLDHHGHKERTRAER